MGVVRITVFGLVLTKVDIGSNGYASPLSFGQFQINPTIKTPNFDLKTYAKFCSKTNNRSNYKSSTYQHTTPGDRATCRM